MPRRRAAPEAAFLAVLLFAIPLFAVGVFGVKGVPALLRDRVWIATIWPSLGLAAGALGVALPLGAAAAVGIWRQGRGFRRLVLGACLGVLLLPGALLAQALNWAALGGPVPASWADPACSLIGQGIVGACLVLLVVTARLNRLDPAVLHAARAAGAGPLAAWRVGVWPSLGLGFAGGVVLAMSFAASALGGASSWGRAVGDAVRRGTPEAAPAALLLGVCLLVVLGVAGSLKEARRGALPPGAAGSDQWRPCAAPLGPVGPKPHYLRV